MSSRGLMLAIAGLLAFFAFLVLNAGFLDFPPIGTSAREELARPAPARPVAPAGTTPFYGDARKTPPPDN